MSDKIEKAQEDGLGTEDITFDENNHDLDEEVAKISHPAATREDQQAVTQIQSAEEEEGKTEMPPQDTSEPSAASTTTTSSEISPASDSKFFAIRTTGGQERIVASQIQVRINANKIGIRSVMVLDSFKGYIIVEAPDSNIAYEALAGIRHVRGQIRGDLPFKDIEGYLVKKPVVAELNIDDTVEVIAGPFKSMKAKITRVDYEKQEATVVLLDSPYQIPVTVDANYLKKTSI
jgi:transcriptional antiterminator NusG